MLSPLSLLLLAALPFAQADVKITSPAAAATVPGTGALTINFADGGGQPTLAQLDTIMVYLLAGGNTDANSMVVGQSQPAPIAGSSSLSLTLDPSKGPSTGTANAFYLKVVSTQKSGSPVTSYSQRFTVTGMTGTWKSTAIQQAAADAGKDPANVPNSSGGSGSNGGGGDNQGDPHPSGTWPPYSMQSGTVKFAPMQGRPGTAITQTKTDPLYPTSAWTVFTTMAPIPPQITTQTPSNTLSASSRENTASAAAPPAGANDMERWLARWRD